MNISSEPDILTEVPETLKRLVRYIVRGFYGIDHAIVIEMLIHHPCIKEDDLMELLRFERKPLRQIINNLKTDKFIKVRMRVETDAEGRTSRHNYYFINYTVFVNVVKYKLDHMRRKIETEERDSTSRASFKCPNCQKSYTDLDVGELVDPMTGSLLCVYCKNEVEEEQSRSSGKDARTLMVKFNEQIEPIYGLLREVEDIKLAANILEPEPLEMKTSRSHGGSGSKNVDRNVWSGDTKKGVDIYGGMENKVTIEMEGEEGKAAVEKKQVKERPVWMTESTVQPDLGNLISKPSTDSVLEPGPSQTDISAPDNDIMKTLLAHEKSSAAQPPHLALGVPASDNESSTSEEEDENTFKAIAPAAKEADIEEMESEDDDEILVTIGNRKVPIDEITDDMVAQMTPSEKEAYISLGQQMYQHMYD